MTFQRTFTKARWEPIVGYCRALRAGDRIFVTGTVSVDDDGAVHAADDPYGQAVRCLDIIQKSLGELGASIQDVTRTRMYVADITNWEAVGRAHGERFADHPPATTMVEVASLMRPEFLIEIEADAVVL